SLNLDAVPTLVNKRAAAIASQPYQCEWMGWLNTGAELARGGVNNPALYATAPVLRGFQVVLEELELGPDWIPSAMRGALVVGSNNPKSLVAMAAMAVPQVAAMDIQPDGSVTPLELPAVPNMPQVPAWVSMVENALGVGFGEGADARLPQYLKGDASQQPLLVFGYSGRAYALAADFMERAVAQMEALEAAAAGNAAADGGADDAADGADAADAAALADADADADADAHADADVDADDASDIAARELVRSEEHTSELQS